MRNLLLGVFFVGLAALEIAHGVHRVDNLRRDRSEELRADIERRHGELVDALRPLLQDKREHAFYSARMPIVRDLLRRSPDDPTVVDDFGAYFLHYLTTFRGIAIDRVRLLDREGRERCRCQRNGDSVASLPAALLAREPDVEMVKLARERAPGVGMSSPMVDAGRVEVPETDRQVLHFSTLVTDPEDQSPLGVFVLTVYASPLFNRVRQFVPVKGGTTSLVDGGGAYLASRDRIREVGGATPGSLGADFAVAAPLLLGGERWLARGGTTFLSADVSTDPAWKLVTCIPDDALAAAAVEGVQAGYVWIIVSTLAVTIVLAAAMAFFLRLSRREAELREAQRHEVRQRELERQLSIAERLSSLGQVTAGVAHEINNPLEGIGNYLSLLEREDLPSTDRSRFLDQVRHGFDRIRNIVRDLSSFARPEPNPMEVAELGSVVRRALDLVRYAKEFRAVEVALAGLDEPIQITGDPGRLEQVFINLLLNAAQAMEGQGSIRVAARRQRSATGDEIEVVVDDTGPGIAAELLPTIFDPFVSTKHSTGLGLAISYGIVRVHSGTLTAENRPEGGARFRLRLPAFVKRPAAAPEEVKR